MSSFKTELAKALSEKEINMKDIRELRPKGSVYERGLLAWIEAIPRSQRGIVVQVGVWTGAGTKLLARHFKRVIDVDPWYGTCENDYSYDDVFGKYIAECGCLKNVTHIRKESIEAAKCFSKESIDVVYIDAIHRYANVKEDSFAWMEIVKKGGYIGGHDYCDTFPGVIQAVHEIFGNNIQLFEDGSWLTQKA